LVQKLLRAFVIVGRGAKPTPPSRSAPVFAVSRFIGSSIAMIDRHYGHLARDSRQHAVAPLDALAHERAVDAAWTWYRSRASAVTNSVSRPRRRRVRWAVDARWTPRLFSVAPADNEGADQQELPEAL